MYSTSDALIQLSIMVVYCVFVCRKGVGKIKLYLRLLKKHGWCLLDEKYLCEVLDVCL